MVDSSVFGNMGLLGPVCFHVWSLRGVSWIYERLLCFSDKPEFPAAGRTLYYKLVSQGLGDNYSSQNKKALGVSQGCSSIFNTNSYQFLNTSCKDLMGSWLTGDFVFIWTVCRSMLMIWVVLLRGSSPSIGICSSRRHLRILVTKLYNDVADLWLCHSRKTWQQ